MFKPEGEPRMQPLLQECRTLRTGWTCWTGEVERMAAHESKQAAMQDLFKTMLNKLMTGDIRVKDMDIDESEVEG